MIEQVFGIDGWWLALIACAALGTSAIHGATGLAGGFLMAAVLAPIIGVKPAVPAMSIALLISHLSRGVLNWRDIDWQSARDVMMFGAPMVIAGAIAYGLLPAQAIALLLALVLLASLPLRHWAKRNHVKTSRGVLRGVGSVWGFLSGNTIGPGMLLTPFLLGTGMGRAAFVGTLAAVTLVNHILKIGVFGATSLLGAQVLAIGLFIGVLTIPGNWFGRKMLQGMSDTSHGWIVDGLTLIGALNFLYLAFVRYA